MTDTSSRKTMGPGDLGATLPNRSQAEFLLHPPPLHELSLLDGQTQSGQTVKSDPKEISK